LMKCVIALSLALCASSLRLSPTSPEKKGSSLAQESASYPKEVLKFVKNEIANDFPGMQKKAAKDMAMSLTKQDGCGATMIVGFNEKKPTSGFGSKVNNFMNQLALAAYGGFSVSMWSPGHFEGIWNQFFENSLPVCKHEEAAEYPGLEHGGRMFWQELSKNHPDYVVQAKRDIYKAHYKYNQQTAAHIEEALKKKNLPKEFYGVHIRTGDKARETSDHATKGVEGYANEILKKKDEGIRTVWLATVDPDVEQQLQKALGSEYDIKVLSSGDGQWERTPGDTYEAGSEKMFNLLTDVEALRRSSHFIGTASSNMGRLVYFLREEKSTAVSLDEDFLARAA